MPALLVSVRTADEARDAWNAGARIIDIKDPARGPLGMADVSVWDAVRASIPPHATISAALGELPQCESLPVPNEEHWNRIAWRKVGLAGMAESPHWQARLETLHKSWGPRPGWIAVAYLDAAAAHAPTPQAVIEFLLASQCGGILFDTWSKQTQSPLDNTQAWRERIQHIRAAGFLVALAGGLCCDKIRRLKPLEPDLFAVRGAACFNGDRLAPIDPVRVADLVAAASA